MAKKQRGEGGEAEGCKDLTLGWEGKGVVSVTGGFYILLFMPLVSPRYVCETGPLQEFGVSEASAFPCDTFSSERDLIQFRQRTNFSFFSLIIQFHPSRSRHPMTASL
jgi:hypothetical protein